MTTEGSQNVSEFITAFCVLLSSPRSEIHSYKSEHGSKRSSQILRAIKIDHLHINSCKIHRGVVVHLRKPRKIPLLVLS